MNSKMRVKTKDMGSVENLIYNVRFTYERDREREREREREQ